MKAVKSMQAGNGHWGYQNKSPEARGGRWTLTGVGTYCLQLWESDGSDNIRNGIKAIIDLKDYDYDGERGNLYTWYYNTLACYQRGGISWQKWNRIFRRGRILNPECFGLYFGTLLFRILSARIFCRLLEPWLNRWCH